MYCFSSDHAALGSNIKVWFVTSHDVSVWSYLFTCGLVFQVSD